MRGLLIVAALLVLGNTAPGAPIEVAVAGVRSDAGMVRVSVCPEDRFMKACPWWASAPAHIGTVTVTVANVPPGHYAVQAFHDADGDGKLGTNWIGIPREGIGFSNDAMPRLRIPRFSIAAFDHGTTPQHVPVTVRYFLG